MCVCVCVRESVSERESACEWESVWVKVWVCVSERECERECVWESVCVCVCVSERVCEDPETWAEGLITPIYTKGDKFDPNNYRGICVGSNLAKLFCAIMNNRIVTFLTRRSILHKSQIGFLPKQRTSDHIYSLHTLINKNLKGKQRKIFTCFVDLKKSFRLCLAWWVTIQIITNWHWWKNIWCYTVHV